MSREETVTKIRKCLQALQSLEPRSTVYTGPEGEIEAVIYGITGMDPLVEFRAKRTGDIKAEAFSLLPTAFVYLFGQTPHILR